MSTNYLNNSEEELLRLRKEREEEREKRLEEIKRAIEKYDEAEDMKFALLHLEEPDKIAEYVNSNSVHYFDIYQRLSSLRSRLEHRANLLDEKSRLIGEHLYDQIPPKFLRPEDNTSQGQQGSSHLFGVRETLALARELDLLADYYHNNRKELGDDDLDATPLTFFTVKRLDKFLLGLASDAARLSYALKLKNFYVNNDERGEIRSEGNKFFHADDNFLSRLEGHINTYVKTTALQDERPDKSKVLPSASTKSPEFTTNRQVLTLFYMLKHLGVKDVNKTLQAQFIEFLTGKNYKKIYDSVREPDDRVYIKKGEDVRYIREWFDKLGLAEIVKDLDTMLGKKF